MKNKSLKYVISTVLFLLVYNSFSQSGIFTYATNNEFFPNARTVSILQNPNGEIVLLNFCSDHKYKLHSIQLTVTDKNGTKQSESNIDMGNLHELSSINMLDARTYAVFGNTSLNKTFNPFQISIDSKGTKLTDNKLSQVYSTLISDVINFESSFMILYSKVGKNGLYNISLNKVNAENGSIEWLKKISSENNEEADKIIATKNGYFYILGKKYNDDVTEFVPIIYKIDANGEELWKKALDVPANFNMQSFQLLNDDEILYACGYTKSQTGFSETRLMKLSNTGETVHVNSITDFSINGITQINDESYLLFGSKFIVDQKQVITKGKYVIINELLSDIMVKTLDKKDKPDVNLKSKIKTSSDFTCAYKLEDGRIAIGGKIFMPVNEEQDKNNAALLMLINADGTY